jgi:TonB family protein
MASTLSSEGPTPNFGLSLALDRKLDDPTGDTQGSKKGLIFGLLAASLLLAAGGGWYWYSNQPADGSVNGTNSVKSDYVQPAAGTTLPVSPSSEPAKSYAPAQTPAADGSRAAVNLPPVRTDNKGVVVPSNPKSSANDLDPSASATKPAVPELEKKPSIGKVHLAAPVVSHHAADSSAISDSEPALNGNGVSGIDANSLGALASKNNQPIAPLPVGGDVKPARLLSSVAPLYPQLARNQRLGGDVKLDALIDASGRVSSTKVISGPALLHQAAMDAVRQWKYQPATLNGTPMPMHLTVTVQFKAQ